MKRIGAGLVVVMAWALWASAAAQAGVHTKVVRQSPADVVAYWTPARMRAAKPVERTKPGPAPAAAPSKSGAAVEIAPPYNVFPTSTNGKVFFTDGGYNYVCSGTALASTNQSVVWTAGHCVNEGPGAYVTNWAFVPAYRDGQRPYGTFPATTLRTTSQWQRSGDFSYDLGAATVAPSAATGTLTATIGGGRQVEFNGARSQTYNSFGYPAAGRFNGQRLWMCSSPLYTSDTRTSPQTLGIRCDMTGGSSGGGWLNPSGAIASVNSYGYQSLKNVMFGPYQGNAAQTLYNAAQTG